MKIGLLIGGLGRGGSERQVVELARGLHALGAHVEVAVYGDCAPPDDYLNDASVRIRILHGKSKLSKLKAVRDWIRRFQPDVLHGFMKRASMTAILAVAGLKSTRVVASDFSTATYSRHKPILWIALLLFACADHVVTQTATNRRSITMLAPWLRRKISVIRNGVDIDRFMPRDDRRSDATSFRFIVVGTVYSVKNPIRIVYAARSLAETCSTPFRIDWYGRFGPKGDNHPSEAYIHAKSLVDRFQLDSIIRFHGETSHIELKYAESNAILHPSLQEGIPNAVVEAMACGLPIIVSRVSDLPLLVETGQNGFICEGTDAESITESMRQMIEMDQEHRAEMGERSRKLAVSWFSRTRFVSDYLTLYERLIAHTGTDVHG